MLGLSGIGAAEVRAPAASGGFTRAAGEFVRVLEELLGRAGESALALVEGRADVHSAVIDLERARVALELALTVRDRVLEAYREVMHMQV